LREDRLDEDDEAEDFAEEHFEAIDDDDEVVDEWEQEEASSSLS